jgi:pimeloyl-ACP methyl ester carboxylesterase
MSLGTLCLALVLAHLYAHLGLMLALYVAPIGHIRAGEGYRLWPVGWAARVKALLGALYEIGVFYGFIVTYPLGWILPRRTVLSLHPEPDDPRNVPVVLLHGYMMNRCCMAPLRLYLRLQGFRRLYSLNLRRLHGSIETFAHQFRDALAGIDMENERRGAFVVAHSMGGLVASLALEDKATARRLRGIVALGSPFGGTVLHGLGLGVCARQIRPGGVFLRRLAGTLESIVRGRLVSIYTDGDRLVVPPWSSHVDGALSNERLHALGHLSLLLSPHVFRLVRDQLLARRGVRFEALGTRGPDLAATG